VTSPVSPCKGGWWVRRTSSAKEVSKPQDILVWCSHGNASCRQQLSGHQKGRLLNVISSGIRKSGKLENTAW